MYGLKKSARLANDKGRDYLAPFGYFPDPLAPNIWKHTTHTTVFCLCVDKFWVTYFNQDGVDHLTNALRTEFKL